MATIKLRLSSKKDKETEKSEVLIRFCHGKVDQRAKTNIYVNHEYWNKDTQSIKIPNVRLFTDDKKQLKEELQQVQDQLNKLASHIQQSFQSLDKSKKVDANWLKDLIHDYHFPTEPEQEQEEKIEQPSFFDVFTKYIDERDFSLQRKRHMKVVWRTLKRFALYKNIELTFDTMTDETLSQIEKFYKEEHIIKDNNSYSKILDAVPESRTPKPRGKNAINNFMRHLRAFIYWAIEKKFTTNNPFKKYTIVDCTYGTPYYITIDERNKLYHANFSRHPRIARQRDIFVFQCLIGCRVGDLWAMTKDNVVDGAIEYIPNKTKDEDAITVRVPLNSIAIEILERYKDCEGDQLLPFTSQQHYNKDIKTMFRGARLNRIVTVLNPTTRTEEKRPLYEVASSHMARRCFIGNLYSKVKDPNAIGSMTGHVVGSKAFARYRKIDDDVKKELVTMLE